MPWILILIILAGYILFSCIRIVPQGYEYVIERLGRFKTIWPAGLHLKMPVIERIANKVNIKEMLLDGDLLPVITKDNVTMQIDSVVYFKVFDSHLFTYGITDALKAMDLLSATTRRNIIGEMTLDETLTSRETVNSKMRTVLDEATDQWGIKVTRVEIKNIVPPQQVKEAMEQQVTAERNKRAEILEAEGHKQSDILKAEGHKAALILDAEADKQKKILEAEAERQAQIERATGQADAIRRVEQANADGLRMLKEAGADETVLRLKSIEALATIADGNATKIFLPAELSGIAGLASGFGEIIKSSQEDAAKKTTPAAQEKKNVHQEPDFLKREII